MRSCPVCDNPSRAVIMDKYFVSPFPYPTYSMYQCLDCGMKYLDAELLTKELLDNYYLHDYITDDDEYSKGRLESLALEVSKQPHEWNVCDIGGMDGKLRERLLHHGMIFVRASGVNDTLPHSNIFIMSHTLEHVYDVQGMMEDVSHKIQKYGMLFIEIPIWLDDAPLDYDHHFQHINKFRPKDIELLLQTHDFKIEHSFRLPDYREYHAWRIIGRHG
jgi:hypothetical protein